MHNAIALASAGLGAAGALGAPASCPSNVSGTRTTACSMTGSDSLTVTSSGSILVDGPSAVLVDSSSTSVSIINQGTISASTASDDAFAISIDGAFNGSINNSGTITGLADGSSGNSAAGIYISSTLAEGSSITNSGTITGTSKSSASWAYGYGLYLDYDLAGTVTNNTGGEINGTATGTGASAYGVLVYYTMDSTGSIANSGTITSTANATSGYVYAYGIYVDDYMYGSINNDGDINVEANGKTGATATGIYLSSTMYDGSELINSGTISVTGTTVSGEAEAAGVYIYDMEGDAEFTNTETGVIEATATGDYVEATGVYVAGSMEADSTVTNAGTITVSATGATEDAEAWGIYVDDYLYGSVNNSGDITVEANGETSATATGIYLSSTMYDGSELINSGTISVTATSVSGEAEALGVYIYDMDGDAEFTNTETGVIEATATGDYASATGALVTYSMEAESTFTNDGTITVSATGATESAEAWGIYIGGAMDGTLNNSGTVTVTANGATDAEAYGIELDSGLGGSLTHSGMITVTASATDDATAEGITIDSTLADGSSLTNSGSISATATTTEPDSDADARGIYVEYMDDATLSSTVDGSISAIASGGSAEATGIEVDDMGVNSSVVNAGSITVSTTASTAEGEAIGIHIDSSMEGSILNSGDISATAEAAATAEAYGILIHDTLSSTGTVEHSGSITVSASGGDAGTGTGTTSTAVAAGIYAEIVEAGGSIVSSGTITASATGSMAEASGIRADGYMEGSISNSSDITVSGAEGAGVHGILINSTLADTGSVDNSGTITVTGPGGSTSGTAGIYVWKMETAASLSNSGSITASPVEGAFSLYVDMGMGGNVNNSGRLEGDLHLHGTSLTSTGTVSMPVGVTGYIGGDYTQGSNGLLEIGVLDASDGGYGRLEVEGTADLTASGELAMVVDAEDDLADEEVLEDVLSAGTLVAGALNVTDDTTFWNFTAVDDGDNNIDIIVERGLFVADAVAETGPSWAMGAAESLDVIIESNPTGDMADVIDEMASLETVEEISAATAQMVPVLVAQSSQMVNLSLNELTDATINRVATRQGMASGDEMMGGQHLWIKPYGSQGEQDDVDDVPGYDVDSYGLIIGYDLQLNDSWLIGGAIGYSETEVEDDSNLLDHELDVDSIQLSGYAEWELDDRTFVDFIGVIGSSETDSERTIRFADIDRTAKGNYDSWYGRVYVGLGRDYKHDKLTLTPVLSAAYTYIDEDSYTEKDAGDLNLDVDDNDIDALVLGLDGRASYELNDNGSLLTAHVGVGYDTLTDEVVLSSTYVGGGPAFRTAGPEPDEVILQAGVGLEFHATDTVDIYFNYEYESRDDFENQLLTATVRWAF